MKTGLSSFGNSARAVMGYGNRRRRTYPLTVTAALHEGVQASLQSGNQVPGVIRVGAKVSKLPLMIPLEIPS